MLMESGRRNLSSPMPVKPGSTVFRRFDPVGPPFALLRCESGSSERKTELDRKPQTSFTRTSKLANGNRLAASRMTDRLPDLRRKPEPDIFRHPFYFFDAGKTVLMQVIHHVFHQNLRRRRSSRNGYCGHAF